MNIQEKLNTFPLQLKYLSFYWLLLLNFFQLNFDSIFKVLVDFDGAECLPDREGQGLQFVESSILSDSFFCCGRHIEPDEDLDHTHTGDDDSLEHLSPLEDWETRIDIVKVIDIVVVEPGLGRDDQVDFPDKE